MATRRRARMTSLTAAMSDVRQRLQYLEARPSRSRIAAYAVRRTNVQPRAISTDQMDFQSATTEIIADDAITNDKIAVDSISTDQIQGGAVTNPELGGGVVDGRVLADNTVESRHIKDGEVKSNDIGPGEVKSGNIGPGEVKSGNIGPGEVKSGNIGPGEVKTSNIDGLAVTNEKLAADSVGTGKIRNLNVTNNKIADGAINNPKITNGAVDESKLANNAVSTVKIQQNAVVSSRIAPGAVGTTRLADGGVTRPKLSFTPVETVSAGTGLSGGGSARSVSLSVNFSSVARANHAHDSLYSARIHNHAVSGETGTTSGTDLPAHRHGISLTSGAPSSSRYKKDISDYSIDVQKLMDLNIKKFRYLNQYKNRSANREWFFGYIAEEVQELGLEELLVYDQDGLPSGVNYALVGVFALELIKLQEEKINNIEAQLQQLLGETQ